MATTIPIDAEENGRRLSWQEEIIARSHGWQARDEAEFLREEILPFLQEPEERRLVEEEERMWVEEYTKNPQQ